MRRRAPVLGVEGVEVEDELEGNHGFVRGVRVPVGSTDVTVDVNADAEHVFAADLLRRGQKAGVFHQRGAVGGALVSQAGPQALGAILTFRRVLGGKAIPEFAGEVVEVVGA